MIGTLFRGLEPHSRNLQSPYTLPRSSVTEFWYADRLPGLLCSANSRPAAIEQSIAQTVWDRYGMIRRCWEWLRS
jgi:hypothetical protein